MFIYLLVVFSKRFHLKIYKKCKFIGGEDTRTVKAGNADGADLLTSNINKKQEPVIVSNKEDKVFDIEGFKDKLIYYRENGGINQKFTFKFLNNEEKLVKLEVMSGCITYVEDMNIFKRQPCDDSNENQIFEFRHHGDLSCRENNENESGNLLTGEIKPAKNVEYAMVPIVAVGVLRPIVVGNGENEKC